MDENERQSIVDAEHLKLLAWGYYISAGMAALFSLFGLLYVVMGVAMGSAFSAAAMHSAKPADQVAANFPVWFFAFFGLAIFLAMITAAVLKFLTARKIQRRNSRIFCFIVAGLGCLEFPYGMALGVFTFILLARPSVARMFDPPAPPRLGG